MKLPTIFQLVFCSATLALAADDQPAKSIPEAVEWLEVRVNAADDHKLPRVLLVGDSITGGYFPGVVNELKGRANVARFASSRGLGDPALFKELALMLEQYQFSVIHFNNGLHGWAYTEDDYRAAFPKLLQLLKEHAPGAKLIWASTTPHRMGAPKFEQFDPKNNRIQERNRIAAELVAQAGIPVNDLYALEENHPEHMTDGCHYKPESAAVQAKQVARFVAAALPVMEGQVTVVADLSASRRRIPDDFLGLSLETNELLPDRNGKHQFSPENLPLRNLLQTIGVKSLRFGGNAADAGNVPDPELPGIDAMFELAGAIDASVIYTVRFSKEGRLNGFVSADPKAASEVCRHILAKYPGRLVAITIGNEPDMYFSRLKDQYAAGNVATNKSAKERADYLKFREAWKEFAAIIHAGNPAVKFNGPSTTGRAIWGRWFSEDFAKDDRIALFSNHWYPGGNGKQGESEPKLKAALSPDWHKLYAKYLTENGFAAMTRPFRIEEMNSYYYGGAPNMSDSMAAALWALDFSHWFAAHGCAGLNFHTCTHLKFMVDIEMTFNYASFIASDHGYTLRPIGYGLTMFNLGSRGESVPLTIENGSLNLSAHAVAGRDGNLYVTLINKEYDTAARTAPVRFRVKGGRLKGAGESLALLAPGNDVRTKSGITLGSAPVAEDGTWAGKWNPLPADSITPDGIVSVTVPPSSALVLRIPADAGK